MPNVNIAPNEVVPNCTKHGCRLSKMRVWKDEETISGFEAVFEYPRLDTAVCFDTEYGAVGNEGVTCADYTNSGFCSQSTASWDPSVMCCSCSGGQSGAMDVVQETFLFGTKGLVKRYEEASISEELIGIGLRFSEDGDSDPL